jgi:hypothetical protein
MWCEHGEYTDRYNDCEFCSWETQASEDLTAYWETFLAERQASYDLAMMREFC